MLDFLSSSPTPWHAVQEMSTRLKKGGFTELDEKKEWKLELGKSYFVKREGTLLCAFRLPKKKPTGAIIAGAHTDSPGLKIRPCPDIETKEISQLGTEIYGGPLLNTWLNIALGIAGKIETDKGSQLVFIDDCSLIIPQLPIHLDPTVSDKGLALHKHDHMRPILSINGKMTLEKLLKKHLTFQTLYAYDLFLVPLQKATYEGLDKELIASSRLDNLTSCYAALEAILGVKNRTDLIQMIVCWDHEEIGSRSSAGADSPFLSEILERICKTREEYFCLKNNSLLLSADAGHGWNPNYAEKYDALNSAFLGKGPLLKYSASRKFATDSTTASALLKIAKKQKIDVQHFCNASHIPSGSTIGPIASSITGIPTIDLGVPLWAMHSTREIMATSDQKNLSKLIMAMMNEWK